MMGCNEIYYKIYKIHTILCGFVHCNFNWQHEDNVLDWGSGPYFQKAWKLSKNETSFNDE